MAKSKAPQLVESVAESSDEEIDEDLAFNSDDERMYGNLFKPKKSSSKRKREQQQKRGVDFDSEESSIDDGESDGDEDDDDHDDESGEESDDGFASDDDDDEGDGGQFMLDLLNNLDKKETDAQKEVEDMRALMAHSSKVPESEFGAGAGKSSTNSTHFS